MKPVKKRRRKNEKNRDTLGMKRNAVYKRHKRALDKLKVIIEEANEK